ncbi:MAG: hypothetical protein ACYCW6_22710 [Candidatus Xenobia bacterium]
MDLDAILKRRPQVVFIDQMARENPPGCRPEYRWEDCPAPSSRGSCRPSPASEVTAS